MKPVHLLGMVALVGAMFLAMSASSVSARTTGATPAETDVNAMPHGAPPTVAPSSTTQPSILPTPAPGPGYLATHPNLGQVGAPRTAGTVPAQLRGSGNAGNFDLPPPPMGIVPRPIGNGSYDPGTAHILPVPGNAWA